MVHIRLSLYVVLALVAVPTYSKTRGRTQLLLTAEGAHKDNEECTGHTQCESKCCAGTNYKQEKLSCVPAHAVNAADVCTHDCQCIEHHICIGNKCVGRSKHNWDMVVKQINKMGAIAKCARIKDNDVMDFMKRTAMLQPAVMGVLDYCSIQVEHCKDVQEGTKFFAGRGCGMFFMRDTFNKDSPYAWRQCRNGAADACDVSSYYWRSRKWCAPADEKELEKATAHWVWDSKSQEPYVQEYIWNEAIAEKQPRLPAPAIAESAQKAANIYRDMKTVNAVKIGNAGSLKDIVIKGFGDAYGGLKTQVKDAVTLKTLRDAVKTLRKEGNFAELVTELVKRAGAKIASLTLSQMAAAGAILTIGALTGGASVIPVIVITFGASSFVSYVAGEIIGFAATRGVEATCKMMHDLKMQDFTTNKQFWLGNFVRSKSSAKEAGTDKATTTGKKSLWGKVKKTIRSTISSFNEWRKKPWRKKAGQEKEGPSSKT